jgi:hypothetical protein
LRTEYVRWEYFDVKVDEPIDQFSVELSHVLGLNATEATKVTGLFRSRWLTPESAGRDPSQKIGSASSSLFEAILFGVEIIEEMDIDLANAVVQA